MSGNNLNKKAFTLIELLVVIAIIAMLSSIILASLNQARSKSRDARRVADIKQLQLALSLYYNDKGSYPAALSSLSPDYISVVPNDPGPETGAAYAYAQNTSSYVLRAKLETNDSVLNNDIDGTNVNGTGIDCTDSSSGLYYCVTP